MVCICMYIKVHSARLCVYNPVHLICPHCSPLISDNKTKFCIDISIVEIFNLHSPPLIVPMRSTARSLINSVFDKISCNMFRRFEPFARFTSYLEIFSTHFNILKIGRVIVFRGSFSLYYLSHSLSFLLFHF